MVAAIWLALARKFEIVCKRFGGPREGVDALRDPFGLAGHAAGASAGVVALRALSP